LDRFFGTAGQMVSRTLLIIIILAAATTWYGYAEECDDHGSAEPQSGGSGHGGSRGGCIYPYDGPSDRYDPYDRYTVKTGV